MTTPIDIVILAAGKGSRMRSNQPKVLHQLAGKPLLGYLFELNKTYDDAQTHVVVGHGAEDVKAFYEQQSCHWVTQHQQLGTGHAVQQAVPNLRDNSIVLILSGDVPLIQQNTIDALLQQASDSSMGLLTIDMDDPTGYGRIVRNHRNDVVAITEHKDCNEQQFTITEINTGIMAIQSSHLKQWLPQLSNNNAQQEYYLTDIIALAHGNEVAVKTAHPTYPWEVDGINDKLQLQRLERQWQQHLASQYAANGLGMADCTRVDIRGQLQHGMDCFIDTNVIFEGDVRLGNNVRIGANCVIRDTMIGDDVNIDPNSMIDNATLGNNVNIGPFARLRPGTHLQQGAKIGNFVETKNTTLGENSKANHLAYVGDAEVSNNVNIGAGVITCNYDGANKHKTIIEENAFIGSNASLIAPVTVGKNATVGASSAIGKDVSADSLALTRVKQHEINPWQRPTKNK